MTSPPPSARDRNPTSTPRARGCLMGLILCSTTCLLLLGAGELLARRGFAVEKAADKKMAGSPIGFDRRFGFKGIAGFKGIVGGVRVSINANGFRDESWQEKLRTAEADPTLPRILLLGDSMTYGYFIERTHRLSEQLEWCHKLHARGAVVFNAAMPGYGPAEQMRVLEKFLPMIRPTHVVLRYCSNDFGDSALPYDYRSPNRVYRPFYNRTGELVLNETVPRRFSAKVKGTFWERFDLRYAMDRLQYTFDDFRYHRLSIYEDLDIPPGDKARRSAIVSSLGHLATHPGSKEVFLRQRERALALWSRMRDTCRAAGAEFLMTGTIDPTGSGGEPVLLRDFDRLALPFLNYHELLAPWQPWAYVEGDGHPNLVDNFVVATAVFNRLHRQSAPIDFKDASWRTRIPTVLEMTGSPQDRLLRWGPWGKTDRRFRDASTGSRLLLQHPRPGSALEIRITGLVPRDSPGWSGDARPSLQVLLPKAESEIVPLPQEGPFDATLHLPPTDNSCLFLRLAVGEASASGTGAQHNLRIHAVAATTPANGNGR